MLMQFNFKKTFRDETTLENAQFSFEVYFTLLDDNS